MPSDRLRKERQAVGLCRCGNQTGDGIKMCHACRERKTENDKIIRAKRRAGGLCRCGEKKAEGRASCPRCLKKQADASRKSIKTNTSNGLCSCGRPKDAVGLCSICIKRRGDYRRSRSGDRSRCLRCQSPPEPNRRLCAKHAAYQRVSGRLVNERVKRKTIDHYGGSCQCCGERRIEFLTIDHTGGRGHGARHRESDRKAYKIYRWLKNNGFPEGFRVLCMNCNFANGIYGECPHEQERKEQAGPSL